MYLSNYKLLIIAEYLESCEVLRSDDLDKVTKCPLGKAIKQACGYTELGLIYQVVLDLPGYNTLSLWRCRDHQEAIVLAKKVAQDIRKYLSEHANQSTTPSVTFSDLEALFLRIKQKLGANILKVDPVEVFNQIAEKKYGINPTHDLIVNLFMEEFDETY